MDGVDGGLTRRAVLGRFAIVAGGLVAGPLVTAANAAVSPAGFGRDRQRVFVAVAETFDRIPGSVVDLRRRDLVGEMTSRYETSHPSYQQWVDALLDGIEYGDEQEPFSGLSVEKRRERFRRWRYTPEAADRLMLRYRPSDKEEPGDVRASYKLATEQMRAFVATLPPESLEPERPEDLLPAFAEPPTGEPEPITEGEPLGTEVRIRRQLRADSYQLVGSFFFSDRDLFDEVNI